MTRIEVPRRPGRNRSAIDGPTAPGRRGGLAPLGGLGDLAADPEDQPGGQHAHEEHQPGVDAGHQEGGDRGQQDADVHRRLEHGGQPGPPPSRPGLREQGCADGPLAADPQRRQEPEDQEVPPGLRDRGEPGEEGIGQDRQRQRPAAAQAIAEPAEEAAAQRPAQQERRLDPRAVPPHAGVVRVGQRQQRGHERRRDQRVEVHVQAVEQPAQPGRQPRFPLRGRDVAEASPIRLGRVEGGGQRHHDSEQFGSRGRDARDLNDPRCRPRR